MSLHRGSRKARRIVCYVTKAFVEELEQRQLLTTLHGGETAEYQDAAGNAIRITVQGPSSAQFDFIGATSQPDNTAQFGQSFVLNDIPMTITRANGTVDRVLGGFGGAQGIELIQAVTGAAESDTDLIGGPAPLTAPSAGINIANLSSDSTGRTYGINVIQSALGGTTQKLIDLVSINYKNVTLNGVTPADAVVVQDLGPQIVAQTGAVDTTQINSIIAMDFLPSNDNLLYFVASVNVPRRSALNPTAAATAVPIPFLLSYDFSQPVNQRVALVGEFISDPANGGFGDVAPVVQGFSFTSNDHIVAMLTGSAVGGRGDTTAIGSVTGLVDLTVNNLFFGLNNIVPVTLNGVAVTTLRSLEVIPGDDDFVYGINAAAGGIPELLHVKRQNINAGVAVDFGPLGNTANPLLGQNLGDLAWNPALINPFFLQDQGITRKGALIAEDTGTDQLVVVDQRDRFPRTNLFSIYGTHTTSTTSLSIALVPPVTTIGPRPMEPFTGTPGPLQVHPAQIAPGLDINVTPPAGTGTVFIGARTINIDPTTTTEENRPVLQIRKGPSQGFGNLPKTTKYVPAGITIVGDMDNILIGGTLTGFARLNGNTNLLYAGDFLTGDAEGRSINDSAADVLGNIYATGDLRNLITASTFGSTDVAPGNAPTYLTGFSVAVGGHLGQMESIDAYVGAQTSVSGTEAGSGAPIQEIEDRRGTPTGSATYFQGFQGAEPSLGDSPLFNNDSYQTAQFIGTAQNNAFGSDEVAIVNGEVRGVPADTIDYYAMGLLGGQSVTVQLSMVGSGNVTIFDPDQRLIDSDLSTGGLPQLVAGQPFTFKADRPGAYRFAVSGNGDYTLRVTGAAKVTLGGVVVGNDLYTYDKAIAPFRIHKGDAGAFQVGAEIVDSSLLAYTVDNGNLRSVDTPDIGTLDLTTTPPTFTNGMNLRVPKGSVGLIRATDATTTGILAFNLNLAPLTNIGTANSADAIGGDYQLISAANEFTGFVLADRAIGTIRTAQIATNTAPFFIANADQKGQDGIIDLIDDTGDFGTIGAGGPHLFTGPGGNVRYIRVGGNVFKSSVFGAGNDVATTLAPGKTMRLIDDSGTNFKLSPTPLVANPNFGLNGDTNQFLNPGNLSVLTYSVDDHKGGGVVVLNVTLDNAGVVGNHGLLVESGAQGNNGSVEIGTITLTDAGRTITETPAADGLGGPPTIAVQDRGDATITTTAPSATTPVDVVFKGPSTIDAWSITGNNIDLINNQTDGEVVNVNATSLGEIDANTIGLAKSHTGADPGHSGNAVNGITIQNDDGSAFPNNTTTPVNSPFVQQRNLIFIQGDLVQARARKGIGNILVQGIIGSIVADSNHKNDPGGGFEGIDGPIVAIPGGANGLTDARIQSVDIGRGIEFGGRGDVPFSGIFAGDAIQSIVGDAVGDDIRGPIQVGGNTGAGSNPVDGRTLTSISLNGGAIIGAYIGDTANFNDWRTNSGARTFVETVADDPNDTNVNDANALHFEIGQIKLKGAGGIIGTRIEGGDIGPISVNGGFGVLNSLILSAGDNRFAGITTTGFGIRDTTISGMEDVTQLIAEGTGKPLSTNGFTPSVLISHGKSNVMDPFTGTVANAQTDLYRYLGTTLKSPIKKSISASGVIQDVVVQADGNLDKVSAYQIRHRNSLSAMSLAIGQNVGSIVTTGAVDGLLLSGDSLKQFTTGNNVDNTSIDISGPIKNVNIGGTLKGSSEVSALGAEGTLASLTTKRGLYADIHATVSIGSIVAGADLGSHNISVVNTINLLQVGGSIFSGVNVANLLNHKINPFKRLINLVVAG
ncbi:MAG TPA: hypothetical protein VHS31_13795, partial [Tepidisphaeraceae bacterium]|nr:hypothetical protein [Tepidisphaeraceae bacterium]